jgi:predicted dehydrogenase
MALGMWAEVLDRWLGPVRRVAAVTATHEARRRAIDGSLVDAAVPDSLSVSGRLENGVTLSCHFSSHAAFGPGNAIEIFGTRGALAYTLFGDELRGATEGDAALAPIEIPVDEVRLQTTDQEFITAILTGSPVSPTFEDGVRYMEFCDAVARSAETGHAIDLPM